MPEVEPLYNPELNIEEKNKIQLSPEENEEIRAIALGIDELDAQTRDVIIDDVVQTLQNGHPLNRITRDQAHVIQGYIACEDLTPDEAYVKYLGGFEKSRRNLFHEVRMFLEYARQCGYVKVSFHGWNDRLNQALERFGFQKVHTNLQNELPDNYYEITLQHTNTHRNPRQERRQAIERKDLAGLHWLFNATLDTFSDKVSKDKKSNGDEDLSERDMKMSAIIQAYQGIIGRLDAAPDCTFDDVQKAILKLKIARHFQNNDTVDISALYDALIESPKFLHTLKGSIHRLFEIHAQKTLQKIAELRKARAERTGEEGCNPFEWICQTQDGKYVLARLLNMPHLEEESEYMDHCVGTSGDYIKKMRDGEVEIFSVRTTPQRNKEGQVIERDHPVLTIEYNVKTGKIEQMKTASDKYLKPTDPYYAAVMELLIALKKTNLDTGNLRIIRSFEMSELEHLPEPEPGQLLTDKGIVSWEEFDPAMDHIVLKTAFVYTDSETPKEILLKMLAVFHGIDVRPGEIAKIIDEVDENTRVYVGALQTGFFQRLPDTVEHIYTSPDGQEILRKTIEVGDQNILQCIGEMVDCGLSSLDSWKKTAKWYKKIGRDGNLTRETQQFVEQLIKNRISISRNAVSMMFGGDFRRSLRLEDVNEFDVNRQSMESRKEMDLVTLQPADLGIYKDMTFTEITVRAQELGLKLLSPEVGLRYCMTVREKHYPYLVFIGMEPITLPRLQPRIFRISDRDAHHHLADVIVRPEDRLPTTGRKYVFAIQDTNSEAV